MRLVGYDSTPIRSFHTVSKGASLLKKSLLNRSVVQNRIQTLRYQGQNTAMAGILRS